VLYFAYGYRKSHVGRGLTDDGADDMPPPPGTIMG